MAMNRNRRRNEHPTHGGFWSTLLGRKQGGRPAIDDRPEEFEPSTETRSGAGHRPSTETRSGLGHWQWEDVSRHIPFILYCTFLLLVYIANGHSQESMQR
ncbi:MAG: FtsL-like putative cell division protein, partial [Bacteroidota bacterium]